MFDKDIYIQRRDSLKSNIDGGVVILMGNQESARNYHHNYEHFRQDSTFLYYFGVSAENLVGVVDIDNNTETIYGNDYTIDDIIWMGDQPSVSDLAAGAGVSTTAPLNDLTTYINKAKASGRKIHFLPPYRNAIKLQLEALLDIKASELEKSCSMELVRAVVKDREIKSDVEIAELHRAFNLGYEMHTLAMRMARPGLGERQVAGAIEGVALRGGAGVSFHNIVSHHGQTLHNHSHNNDLEAGRILLVDCGAETVMNYCSDNTRSMPVTGTYTSKQRELYDILTSSFDRAISMTKAGLLNQEVQKETLRVLCNGLHSVGLIKGDATEALESGVMSLFMPHGLGHQLGMDVHDMENFGEDNVGYDAETPRSKQFGFGSLRMGKRLRPGHVLSIEPGIYFIPKLINKWKEDGINSSFVNFDLIEREYLDFGGMRVEDTVVVTNDGCINLGDNRIPYTSTQIEEYMRSHKE